MSELHDFSLALAEEEKFGELVELLREEGDYKEAAALRSIRAILKGCLADWLEAAKIYGLDLKDERLEYFCLMNFLSGEASSRAEFYSELRAYFNRAVSKNWKKAVPGLLKALKNSEDKTGFYEALHKLVEKRREEPLLSAQISRLMAETLKGCALSLKALGEAFPVLLEGGYWQELKDIISKSEESESDKELIADFMIDLGLKAAMYPIDSELAKEVLREGLNRKPSAKIAQNTLDKLEHFLSRPLDSANDLSFEARSESDPAKAAELYLSAAVYFEIAGEREESRKAFERAALLGGDTPELFVVAAKLFGKDTGYNLGNIALLGAKVSENSGREKALSSLFTLPISQESERFALLKAAIEIAPQKVALPLAAGDWLQSGGDAEERAETLIKLSELCDPVNSDELCYLAAIAYEDELNRRDAAEEIFERLTSVTPMYPEAMARLLNMFRKKERSPDFDVIRPEYYIPSLKTSEEWNRFWEKLSAFENLPARRLAPLVAAAVERNPEALTPSNFAVVLSGIVQEGEDARFVIEAMIKAAEALPADPEFQWRRKLCNSLVKSGIYPESAKKLLDIAIAKSPEDEKLRAIKLTMLQSGGDWEALLEEYRRELEKATNEEEARRIKLKIGDAYIKLGKAQEAFGVYVELFDKNPLDDQAADGLAAILTLEPENAAEIALKLLERYKQKEDWSSYISALHEAIDSVSEEERVYSLIKEGVSISSEKLEQPDTAFQFMLAGIKRVPRFMQAELPQILAAAREKRHLKPLLEALNKAVEAIEPEAQPIYLETIAEILYKDLADHSKAAEAMEKLREFRREDLSLIEKLESIYSQLGSFDKLIPLLSDKIGMVDGETEIAKANYSIASALLTNNRPEEALKHLREAALKDPAKKEYWGRYFNLAEKLGEWSEAAEAYEKYSELKFSEYESFAALVRASIIRLYKLNSASSALNTLKSALEFQPLQKATLSMLEKLSSFDETRKEALERLAESYRNSLKWTRLVEVLKKLSEIVEGAEYERAALEITDTFDNRLSQKPSAFAFAGEACLKRPESEALAAKLEEAARGAGLEEELAEIYGKILAENPELSDATKMRLSERLSELKSSLDEKSEAVRLLEDALALKPEDAELKEKLIALLRNAGDFRKLAERLEEKLSSVESEEKIEVLKELASIYEQNIGEPELAIKRLEELYELEPTSSETLERLEELYSSAGDANKLVETLERRIALCHDDEAKERDLKLRMARALIEAKKFLEAADILTPMLEDEVSRIEAAEWIKQCMGDSQAVEKGIMPLVKFLEVEEEYEDLSEIIEDAIPLVSDAALKLELYEKLADINREILDNPETAFKACRDAYLLPDSPSHFRENMERLAAATGNRKALSAVYEKKAEQLADKAEELASVFVRVAELAESEENSKERAVENYKKALESAPEHKGALTSLLRLYEENEDWEATLSILERKIALTEEDEGKAALYLKIAEIKQEELADSGAAAQACKTALELKPGYEEAYILLCEALTMLKRWAELKDALKGWLTAASIERRKGVIIQLLRVLWQNLEEYGEAVMLFKALGAEDEAREPAVKLTTEFAEKATNDNALTNAVAALEWHYQALEDYDRLIQTYELLKKSERERYGAAKKIALVQSEKQNAPDKAFMTLASILDDEISNAPYLDDLAKFASEAGMTEELVEILEEHAEDAGREGVNARIKAAQLYEKELDNRAKALACYQEAIKFDPGNKIALDELDRFYRLTAEWDELANILSKKLKVEENQKEKSDLLFRRARLFEQNLESPEDAKSDYLACLEIDPTNRPALHSLIRISEEGGEYELLADSMRRLIAQLDEGAEADKTKIRLAEILEDHLDKPDEALSLWFELEKRDSDYIERAFESAVRIYENGERYQELAEYIQSRLPNYQSAESERKAKLKLSETLFKRLEKPEEAARIVEEILAKHSDYAPALRLASEIYPKIGLWEKQAEVMGTLEKALSKEKEESARKELLISQAKLFATELNDKATALEKAKEAFEIEPHEESELPLFKDVFLLCENKEFALKAFFEYADLAEEDDDRVSRFLEAAELAESEPADAEFASKAYEEILDIEVDHELAQERLEKIYTETGKWEKLGNLLLGRLPLTPAKEDKVSLLMRLGAIYSDKLEQHQKAFLTLSRGLEFDPLNPQLNAALEEAARASESLEELSDLWEDIFEDYEEDEEANPLRLQFARICLKDLDEGNRGLKAALEAVKFASGSDEAHSLIVSIQEKEENREGLAAEYERRLGVPGLEEEERSAALKRLASIYSEELEDKQKAQKTLERLLDEFPEDAEAIEKLLELAKSKGDGSYMLEALDRSLKIAKTDEDRADLYIRRAEIFDGELNMEEQAIREYERVCAIFPANHKALNALDKIYTRREDYGKLVEIVERKIAAVDKDSKKAALLKRLAAIHEEQLDDEAKAIEIWERADSLEDDLAIKKELARLYRVKKNREKLIPALENIAERIEDREEKIETLDELSRLYLDKENFIRGEKVLQDLIELEGDNGEAWKRLAFVFEKTLQWPQACDAYRRVAALVEAGSEKTQALNSAGFIAYQYLQQNEEAIDCYKKTLEIDSSNHKAIVSLKTIYFETNDYENYLKYYKREAEITGDPQEKAKLLAAIGRFYQERLDSIEKALPFFEEALEKKPDFMAAAKPLADYYFSKRDWKASETPLEVLVKNLSPSEHKTELVKEAYRLGFACDQQGKLEDALSWYKESFKLDAAYLPTLEAYGRALIRAEKWQEAIRVHQTLLLHHRDDLDELEIVEIFTKLGEMFMKEGENEKALKSLMRAYELNEMSAQTIENLVEVHTRREDWEAVYDFSEKLAGMLIEDKQAEAYVKLAKFCRDKLQDNFRAISAIENALEAAPEHIEALELAIRMYVSTQQAGKAVEAIEKVVESDLPERKKIIYHLTAGQILHQNLREMDRALAHYEKVLELEPSNVKAFAALEEVLAAKKDWKKLAKAYDIMVDNTPEGDKERLKILLQNQAELYRRALGDEAAATKAYEALWQLSGDDPEMLAVLAELYLKTGANEKAIKVHQKLAPISATPVKSYRILRRLYTETKQVDPIFNICAVLTYIKQANDEDTRFYQAALKKAPQNAERALTDILWDDFLIAPDAKSPIGNVFAILWRRVPEIFGAFGGYQVDKSALVDVSSSMAFLVNMYKYATRTMNVGEPQLYKPSSLSDGVKIGTVGREAVLAVGVNLFKSMDKKEILFALASGIACTRPEFALAATRGKETLEILLGAAVSAVEPSYGAKGDPQQIALWRKKIVNALPPDAATELRKYATVISRSEPDLDGWLEGAQLTAYRAGLLISSDLETAMRAIENFGGEITRVPKRKALREMLMFAISDEYFELRKKLGLAIKGRQ